jgi:hypothetical protein
MTFDELTRPAPRDLDWSDVEADAARMQWDEEQMKGAEYAHSEQVFRDGMTAWVEDLCEGHESLRGDMMGAETFCDGTCRPLAERDESAYLDHLEGMLPDD